MAKTFRHLVVPVFMTTEMKQKDAIWTAVANPDALMRDEFMRVNLDRLIAEDHARAVLKLIDADGFNPTLIGFHGQTIYHNPAGQIEHPLGRDTIQLGNASLLAQITNLPVVYDVRSADMAAGGEGAPLAPVFHAAMLGRLNVGLPAVLVNVGGIANLTWFDGHDGLIGFDTGPGNALMDDYMRKYCDAAFDKNGELAASGIADWQLVHDWLRMPFLQRIGQSLWIGLPFIIVLMTRACLQNQLQMRWQVLLYSLQRVLQRQLTSCRRPRKPF